MFSFWLATSERQLLRAQILAADLAVDDTVETAAARMQSGSMLRRLAWRRLTRR